MRRFLLPSLILLSVITPLSAQTATSDPVWRATENHQFPEGFGKSFGYRSQGGATATMYLYDLNLPQIPDGIDSRIMRDELARSTQEAIDVRTKEGWNIRGVWQDVASFGGGHYAPRVLRVTFEMDKEGHAVVSQLFLMGFKNQFVKFRASYSVQNQAECRSEIDNFFSAFAEKIAQSERDQRERYPQ